MSNPCYPMDCSLPRLLCPWSSPGKSTGVGCNFLLQGVFLTQEFFPGFFQIQDSGFFQTQELNLGLLHWRQILYQLSYGGSPIRSISSVQFSSVAQSCLTLCDPMNCSTAGLPVHHQLAESTQTHVHRVGDAIQPSHPLSSPSPPAPNPSQHQGLFQWVDSSHEVAKVLELQHQSFQQTPRTDLL